MDEQRIPNTDGMSGEEPRTKPADTALGASSTPPEAVGDEAEGLHEQMLDVDTELKNVAAADIPLNILAPTPGGIIPPPTPAAKPTSPPPPSTPPKPVVPPVPMVQPAPNPAVPKPLSLNPEVSGIPVQTQEQKLTEKKVTETPKISPLHEPRSFAALTPLVMPAPKEPSFQKPLQTPPVQSPKAGLSTAPEAQKPLSRPIPPPQAPPPKRISVVEQLRSQSDSILHPLRTYRSDAEGSIKEQNASLITLATAEEARRNRTRIETPEAAPAPAPKHGYLRTILLVFGSVALLAGGVGIVALALIPRTSSTPTDIEVNHLVYVDESVELPVGGLDHSALMKLLTDMRDKTGLSLGLIREIYFTLPTEAGGKRLATVGEVMPKLAPHIPAELVRALDTPFLVGVHVFDGNQGFIILKTSAYEQAFSAMLAWEPTMRADLLPFMDRRARPKLQSEIKATSTAPRVINSSFIDSILRNHDARVLYDDLGDIELLYAFLNRTTIIIATNDRTLQEAITRVSSN